MRSEVGVGFQPCDPGMVHNLNLPVLWGPAPHVMCRYSPGQVSACVHMPPPPSPPSAFSPCLFSGPTVLMAGQHLFSSPSPPQNNGGQGGIPTLSPRGAWPWAGSRTPAGATFGPWVVVFTSNFLYLSDLGFLMTVKMKLVRRCELTASCGRQTDYLQIQPMSPMEPNKEAVLAHLAERGPCRLLLSHCWAAPT